MEFTGGQVKAAERKSARRHTESDQVRPDRDEFKPMVAPDVFDKAQAKLAAAKARAYRAPKTASLWLRGFVVCAKCGKPMRGLSGNPGNGLQPGYLCAEYGRWGTRAPSGCGHFRVEHDLLESLVLDYLTQTAPQIKALLDATTATDVEAARPLLEAINDADALRRGVWLDMLGFVDEHWPGNKARRKTRMSVEDLYGFLYEKVKPQLEQKVADKEAEIEAVLDGFSGLTPKMKDRVNKRLEALQMELDALRRDLTDSRVSWEYLHGLLAARQEALERATATLNQEGHFRQKAEVLKTAVDKIVCHFRRVGKRCYPGLNRGDPGGGRGHSAAHLSRFSPNGFVSSCLCGCLPPPVRLTYEVARLRPREAPRMRPTPMNRQLVLAVAIAAMGLAGVAAAGPVYRSPLAVAVSPRWEAALRRRTRRPTASW